MNTAFLLTGGNMGDRKQNLDNAANVLSKEVGNIIALSGIYETAAWGKTEQPSFLNQCIGIETTFSAMELLQIILTIEKRMGRFRDEKYGPRIIDIDILLYNDDIIDEPSLQIPHPRLVSRRFALTPLNEIAPMVIHPVFKKTIGELLLQCRDMLTVKKLDNW